MQFLRDEDDFEVNLSSLLPTAGKKKQDAPPALPTKPTPTPSDTLTTVQTSAPAPLQHKKTDPSIPDFFGASSSFSSTSNTRNNVNDNDPVAQTADDTIPSFLKASSNRRRRKLDDTVDPSQPQQQQLTSSKSQSLMTRESSIFSPLKSVDSLSILGNQDIKQQSEVEPSIDRQQSAATSQMFLHLDNPSVKLDKWKRWLRIEGDDDDELLKLAQRGADLPVPYPWKEENGIYVNGVTAKRKDKHPLFQDIMDQVEHVRNSRLPSQTAAAATNEQVPTMTEQSAVKPPSVSSIPDKKQDILFIDSEPRMFEPMVYPDSVSASQREPLSLSVSTSTPTPPVVNQTVDQKSTEQTFIIRDDKKYEELAERLNGMSSKLDSLVSSNTQKLDMSELMSELKSIKQSLVHSQDGQAPAPIDMEVEKKLEKTMAEQFEKMRDELESIVKLIHNDRNDERTKHLSLEQSINTILSKQQDEIERISEMQKADMESIESEKAKLQEDKLSFQAEVKSERQSIGKDRQFWLTEKSSIEKAVQQLMATQKDIEAKISERRILLDQLTTETTLKQTQLSSYDSQKEHLQDYEKRLALTKAGYDAYHADSMRMHDEALKMRDEARSALDEVHTDRIKLSQERNRLESMRIQVTAELKRLSERRLVVPVPSVQTTDTGLRHHRPRGVEVPSTTFSIPRKQHRRKYEVKPASRVNFGVDDMIKRNWQINEQSDFLKRIQLNSFILPEHRPSNSE